MMNYNHQYLHGAAVSPSTMFTPVKDHRDAGLGFTHEIGDHVEISTVIFGRLLNWVDRTVICPINPIQISTVIFGRLLNWVDRTDNCPEWTFGIRASSAISSPVIF